LKIAWNQKKKKIRYTQSLTGTVWTTDNKQFQQWLREEGMLQSILDYTHLTLDTLYMLPVNLSLIIDNTRNTTDNKDSDIIKNPKYILEQI
jgi:hypothetical protein